MIQQVKQYIKRIEPILWKNKWSLFLLSKLHLRRTQLNYTIWGEYNFSNEVQRNFDLFLSPEERKNSKLQKHLKEDMIRSYWLYGAIPNEYFMFDFRHKSDGQRAECLTIKQKDELCIVKMGGDGKISLTR